MLNLSISILASLKYWKQLKSKLINLSCLPKSAFIPWTIYRSLERRYVNGGDRSKSANQLKFVKGKKPESRMNSIIDSMVFAQKAIEDKPSGLDYFIIWKKERYAEDTWKPVQWIAYLRRLSEKTTPKIMKIPLLHLYLLIKMYLQLQWPIG